MTNEQKYDALIKELYAIEKRTGLYLADVGVDRENVDTSLVVGSDEYFACLIFCAASAAGFRAEDAGQDINALIGRSIY